MRKGRQIVEQFNGTDIVLDFDQILTKRELFSNLLLTTKFGSLRLVNNMVYSTVDGREITLISKSITYLGKPHPINKKRIQIPYQIRTEIEDVNTLLIGNYYYKNALYITVFPSFDYIIKSMNNSSAHVNVEDFVMAEKNEIWSRVDKKNNLLLVLKATNFESFIEEYNNQLKLTEDIEEISQWFREKYLTT